MMVFKICFYQPTVSTLELKEEKDTEYLIGWESKRVYTSKLAPSYNAFLCNIKIFG